MTKKQVVQTIKAMDSRLSVRWIADYQEWRISRSDAPADRREALAYYTPDNDDAIATAALLAKVQL